MKRIVFACLIFKMICSFSCKATSDSTIQFLKWGITIQINSFEKRTNEVSSYWNEQVELYSEGYEINDRSIATSIILSRIISKNQLAARLRLGFTKYHIESSQTTQDLSANTFVFNAKKEQTDFRIAPGVYYLLKPGPICFHFGFEVPLNIYGNADVYKSTTTYDALGNFDNSQELSGRIENGYSFGLGTFGGASIFINNFAIGAELSFAYLFNDYSGNSIYEQVFKTSSNTILSNHTTKLNFKNRGISKLYAAICISYWF